MSGSAGNTSNHVHLTMLRILSKPHRLGLVTDPKRDVLCETSRHHGCLARCHVHVHPTRKPFVHVRLFFRNAMLGSSFETRISFPALTAPQHTFVSLLVQSDGQRLAFPVEACRAALDPVLYLHIGGTARRTLMKKNLLAMASNLRPMSFASISGS